MTFRRWLPAAVVGLALVAALVVTACGDDRADSGIHGRVLAGCLDEQGNDPRPVVAVQQVQRWRERGSPQLVQRFRSESDGTFSVSLPPGRYLIVADPASFTNGLMKPLDVNVVAGESTEVDPFYDCGMR
jgi:hypothetical protein